MNKAMIPTNPRANTTAFLQVSINPSARCTVYEGRAPGPAAPAAGVLGTAITRGPATTWEVESPTGTATAAGAANLTVSPAFPVTICPKISLSAGRNAYRTPATTMEMMIKAAHILLSAISLHDNAPKLALIA
jgi:hypothetical protein